MNEALDLGFGCFGEGDHTPFIIFIAGDKRQLIDLEPASGTIGDALLEGGRGLIRQFAETAQYYVLVWDGYLTTAGKRQDAVFAEAGAAGADLGLLFAQRYKQAKPGKLSKVGKPLVVTEVTHLWSDADDSAER